MGSGASKQKDEPVRLVNPDAGPEMSESFVNMLEHQHQKAPSALPSATKQPNLDKEYVERVVAERLREERQRMFELDQKRREHAENYNTAVMLRQADDLLLRQQHSLKQQVRAEPDAACVKAEQAVISCYRENGKATLNCRDQVLRLQQLAREAHLQHTTSSQ